MNPEKFNQLVMLSSRPWKEYIKILGLPEDTTELGKTLEIGVGTPDIAKLFPEGQYSGITAHSPEALGSNFSGITQAFADKLPFPPNSFDTIVALMSVPYYLYTQSDPNDPSAIDREVFSEMYRVLRTRGKVYIYPVPLVEKNGGLSFDPDGFWHWALDKRYSDYERIFADLGFSYTLSRVPTNTNALSPDTIFGRVVLTKQQ